MLPDHPFQAVEGQYVLGDLVLAINKSIARLIRLASA